ncbi:MULTISPECIES: MFS transporter [Arthrobacter]|uniref:MFS family arabinose efflux permease n=1 Tax=Arthrobacter bambusae TaxID=1338426 RepID=A0AAW8DFG1_9MICC|nr:MFS transporter [Arthrobacter bambusae]MDP9903924.1 putative MFS family arabinose efflux permease [Arthrobacter bambusae]MDQ0128080.1 putative MFS family arabinose efflux permease [Arthrobacter bambusae]MDQ0179422.1 putative MFS family arabinose efflux permease [Arthrobacter bambusae]
MTTQATSTAGLPLRRKAARVPVLIATLILSILSYQLNASLFSAALPAMAAHFQESTENVAKVQSLFFLTGAVLGMAFSRWSDFLGRRRTLLIVLSMMLCGTVLCLWAPNLTVLLVGRVLQSATSATFTISFLLLSERFSKRLFGISVGVISAVNGGIGGLDGFLGGFITDTIGWQFLFVLVLGVGVLAIVLVAVVVPKRAARTREGRMDWWGAGTLGTFLVLLSNLIGQASTSGWGDIWTLGYLAGAVIAGLAFVAVEKRVARPLIAIEQLRSRQVWPVLASTVLTLAGIFSALNFTVILLSQDAHAGYGLSASMSALLYLTPTAFVGVLTAVFSGWFAQRIGWFKALRISSGLIVVAAVAVAIFAADRWMVFALLIIMGVLYLGQFQSTVSGIAVLNSPKSAPGSVPGLNGACFGIGASVGIAVVAPAVAAGTIAGYQTALWISAGFALAAFAASLILRPVAASAAAAPAAVAAHA